MSQNNTILLCVMFRDLDVTRQSCQYFGTSFVLLGDQSWHVHSNSGLLAKCSHVNAIGAPFVPILAYPLKSHREKSDEHPWRSRQHLCRHAFESKFAISCDALCGMTSHVATPRRDRRRGICNFCVVSHSRLCGRAEWK